MSWFKSNKPAKTERPTTLSNEFDVQESDAHAISAHRQLNRWVDEAYADFVDGGGLDDLPGMGKPIAIPEEDALSSVLKHANVLPPWLETQKEVQRLLKAAVHDLQEHPDRVDAAVIDRINEKIRSYNRQVPTHLLQKGLVSKDNLQEKLAYWE